MRRNVHHQQDFAGVIAQRLLVAIDGLCGELVNVCHALLNGRGTRQMQFATIVKRFALRQRGAPQYSATRMFPLTHTSQWQQMGSLSLLVVVVSVPEAVAP